MSREQRLALDAKLRKEPQTFGPVPVEQMREGFAAFMGTFPVPAGVRRTPTELTGRPSSTHDLTAAREHVLPEARPYLKDLPFLADSGCEGAGAAVHVPVKPARSELDPDTKIRDALLRYQGERGFALMSQRWRTLQRVMLSPGKIGDITKSALVLVQFEHKNDQLTVADEPQWSRGVTVAFR